jgi:hypothetical protein
LRAREPTGSRTSSSRKGSRHEQPRRDGALFVPNSLFRIYYKQRRTSGGGGRKTRHFSDQTQCGQGSGPALCRIRHNDSYRSPLVIISVIPVLNGGGFCPIALPHEKHSTRSVVEALNLGLDRMLVKAAAVLLAAARTSFRPGVDGFLQRRGKPTRAGGGCPFFIVGQKSPRGDA